MKIFLFVALLFSFLQANIGQVIAIKGKATILRDSVSSPLTLKHQLKEKDIIKTIKDTKVQLKFLDNTVITIGEKTDFNIEEYFFDEKKPKDTKAKFGAMKGVFRSITGKIGKIAPERFKLKTKTATIGIRGTTLIADQDKIACIDGAITVTSGGITVDIPAGKISETPFGLPPTQPQEFKGGVFQIADTKESIQEENLAITPQAQASQEPSQTSAELENENTAQEEEIPDITTEQITEEESVEQEETFVQQEAVESETVAISETVSETQELSLAQNIEEAVQDAEETIIASESVAPEVIPTPINYTLSGKSLSSLTSNSTLMSNQPNFIGSSDVFIERLDDILTIKDTIEKQTQLNTILSSASLVNTAITGSSYNPSILALDSSSYVIVWHESDTIQSIKAQRFNIDGTKLGDEILITTTQYGYEPSIALLNDNRFIITWSDYNGIEYNTQAAIYNSDGTLDTSAFEVSASILNQYDTSVATLSDGKYVISWNASSGIAPDYDDVQAIIYNADGTVFMPAFIVNDVTTDSQYNSEVVALANGNFLITWSDSATSDAQAKIYNADGIVVKSDFAFTDTYGYSIKTSAFGANKFILTWNEYSADTNSYEIYASIYSNDGTELGSRFMVNEYTYDYPLTGGVTVLDDESFIITWYDDTMMSPGTVRGKIYNADGSIKVNEFVIAKADEPHYVYNSSITSIGSDRFIVTWTDSEGSSNIYSQIFYINESNQIVSGEITSANFENPLVGSYSGHSFIGSYAMQGDSVTTNFFIESDNLAEFIVGYANETYGIAPQSYTYKNLFYTGTQAQVENIKPNSIYTYDIFKTLEITTNTNLSIESNFNTIGGQYFYNTLTGSMHPIYNLAPEELGASSFESYYISSDGTITGKKLEIEDTTSTLQQTVDASLYGSEAQGVGITMEGKSIVDLGEDTQERIADSQSIQTAYLSNTQDITSTAQALNLSGYTNTPANKSAGLLLNVNQTTGQVDATIDGASLYSFAGSGTPSGNDAYYITADQFGVVLDSGVMSEISPSSTLVQDTGWLVSIPDSTDANGNLIEDVENESSWGYWTAKTYDSSTGATYIDPHSTWVAGTVTDPNIIQAYINDTQNTNMSFSGQLLGAVLTHADSTIDPIKLDSSNYINLTFDFGNGTGSFNGNAAFSTISGESWNTTFTNGTASASTFSASSTNISGTGGGVALTQGALDGSYYGTDSIKSVGGTFNFYNDIKEASGVFKANKN